MDLAVASNPPRSFAIHWAQLESGRPGSSYVPLTIRPPNPPLKEEESFADGSLHALTRCLLEGLGVRHEVVGASWVVETWGV